MGTRNRGCAMNNDRRDLWLTAAECADRTGLTVRALRLYEQQGLIAPKRTGKNWRLYGSKDIERLHEILALKRLGLSLSRITQLLAGRTSDLAATLALQKSALIEARERAERGLSLIATAQAKIAGGEKVAIGELIHLVKETTMSNLTSDEIAWRRYEQARPRRAAMIDAALLDDYVGHFKFDFGAVLTVTREAAGLKAQLTGQPAIEIFAESENLFFYKLVQAQITFIREPNGFVSRLVLHQNGLEMDAQRIEETEAQAINEADARRLRENIAHPQSETTLRGLILQQQQGTPDYARMTDELAAAVREQQPYAAEVLGKLGAVKSMTFKGVAAGGWDVYDAHFERGTLEWRLAISADDRISGLMFRELP